MSERMNNKYSEMKFMYLKYFSLYLLFICTSFDVIQFIFGTSANEKHVTFTEIIFHKRTYTFGEMKKRERQYLIEISWQNFRTKEEKTESQSEN